MTADELHTARHRLEFSQEALGKALGVQRNTITRWETGRGVIPTTAVLAVRFLLGCAISPCSPETPVQTLAPVQTNPSIPRARRRAGCPEAP